MTDLHKTEEIRIKLEWKLKLDDFKIQIEQWYENETQTLIKINQERINIETQRIIIALEATAAEFRLREEARIWAEIHIIVKDISSAADLWLKDETIRIQANIQIQITAITADGQA